jgi:hypothetical protein
MIDPEMVLVRTQWLVSARDFPNFPLVDADVKLEKWIAGEP